MKKKTFRSIISKIVCLLFLISGVACYGIAFAVRSATVISSGQIIFTSTNVYARITGSIEGTKTQNILSPIEIDASTETETNSSWSNLQMEFLDENTEIVITIAVENLRDDSALIVEVVDGISGENLNITKKVKSDSAENFSTVSSFDPTRVGAEKIQTMQIHLSLANRNISFANGFELKINLTDSTPSNVKDIEYEIVDGNAQISAYTGKSNAFVIPETIEGYPTTLKVGTSSGAGVAIPSNVKTIVIPSTMETVPNFAFFNVQNLNSVIIEDGVKSISNFAFGMIDVESITIPASVTGIGRMAFRQSTLKSINILGGGTIEQRAFGWCEFLENVYISSVTSIGKEAFYECSALKNLVLPDNLTTIGYSAFAFCASLKSVSLPEGLTEIGFQAFAACTALENINFPSTLKKIGRSAFQNAYKLSNISLPDSVEFIGDYAFNHCYSVNNETIVIPKNIKQIGGMEYIELDLTNSSLNTEEKVNGARRAVMGTHIFYNCATSHVKAFSLDSSNENYIVVDGVLYAKNSAGQPNVLVSFPSAKHWANNTYTMPDTVTDAYELSMSRSYYLDKLVLSDSFVIKDVTTSDDGGYCLNGHWASNLTAMLYMYCPTAVEVKSTNTRYYSEDGLIYGKDGTSYANTLYYCPAYSQSGKEGERIYIKEGTTTIFTSAIHGYASGNYAMKKHDGNVKVYVYIRIVIPASVTYIGEKALVYEFNNTNRYAGKVIIDSGNSVYEVIDDEVVLKST